jgi:uncharacterized membrane protein
MLCVLNTQKRILLFIFSFSLVVSHYGISYFFMISLIFVILVSKLKINTDTYFLSPTYTLLFSVLTLSWYLYVAGGDIFENITQIGYHFIRSIADILQLDNRSAVTYLSYNSNGTLWSAYKLIHIALQFFIFVGILNLLRSIIRKRTKSFEISLLSIVFYIFLFVQIFKTYGMGLDRIVQITLILLSPLSLWGVVSCIKYLSNIYARIIPRRLIRNKRNEDSNTIFESVSINKNNKSNVSQKARLYFAMFLMIFFVFNSGFIFEAAGDSLPGYCININNSAGWPVYSESEISGISWLKSHENEQNSVAIFNQWWFLKSRDGLLAVEYFYSKNLIPIQTNTTRLYDSYMFLGKYSMERVEEGEKYVDLEDTLF